LRHILIILSIFLFSFTVISCSSSSDSGSSTTSTIADNGTTTTEDTTTTTDTTAPVIAEVNAVTTPTDDNTPNYTFSSDEAGTITYGGSCYSSTTSALSGNNTITLVALSDGTYSDCTITVTDSTGNTSNSLAITSFTIDTTDNTTSTSTTSIFGTSLFNSSYFGD
jgi:large repetitive protein